MYIPQKVYKFKISKLVYAILLSESFLGNFNPFCYTIKCWVDVLICKTIIYWNFRNIIVDNTFDGVTKRIEIAQQ
jgi:hypothetical protein